MYYDIPKHDRVLTQASGTPMPVLGKASMMVKVGKQRLKHTVVIADCLESGIPGFDFLV